MQLPLILIWTDGFACITFQVGVHVTVEPLFRCLVDSYFEKYISGLFLLWNRARLLIHEMVNGQFLMMKNQTLMWSPVLTWLMYKWLQRRTTSRLSETSAWNTMRVFRQPNDLWNGLFNSV